MGNKETVSIRDWVTLGYSVTGRQAEFVNVYDIEQREYFSFYDYEYCLDVSKQYELMQEVMPLRDCLKEAFAWYQDNADEVNKKPYLEYIDNNLKADDSII